MTPENADKLFTLAAQERKMMRAALLGCIIALEHVQKSPANNHLFDQHGHGTKALFHARQLLAPRGTDAAIKLDKSANSTFKIAHTFQTQ